MVRVTALSPTFAVAGQLDEADFAALAQQGFKSVIANRPDGEGWGQPKAEDLKKWAAAAGLQFCFIPLRMVDVLEPPAAETMRAAIADMPGPVLAFCKSGTRSAMAWAAAEIATRPFENVIDSLRHAGVEIPGLAGELRVRATLKD